MARPKIVWDDKQYSSLEYMALIHCTQKEMAGVMHVDEDTLNRLIMERYGCSFSEFYERYSANGNMSLRRSQFKAAEAGNVPMQIWLGKQWLGQKEIVEAQMPQVESSVEQIAKMILNGGDNHDG